jgi:hypothetical protein
MYAVIGLVVLLLLAALITTVINCLLPELNADNDPPVPTAVEEVAPLETVTRLETPLGPGIQEPAAEEPVAEEPMGTQQPTEIPELAPDAANQVAPETQLRPSWMENPAGPGSAPQP